MPFSNVSSISANDLRFYFLESASQFPLNNLYKGGAYVSDASENTGVPSSGAISFEDLSGTYARRTHPWFITSGATAGRVGFDEAALIFGSFTGTQYYTSATSNVITISSIFQQSGILSVALSNADTTSALLGWNSNSHLNAYKLTITSASPDIEIDLGNHTGTGGFSGHAYYRYDIPYANTLFTNGVQAFGTIEWIE